MTTITVHYGDWGLPVTVTQTNPPCTWELDYPSSAESDHRNILRAAEHTVLHTGADRLVATCPHEQEDPRERLESWPTSTISEASDRYAIELVIHAPYGLIHDDFDLRIPLGKTTCSTCHPSPNLRKHCAYHPSWPTRRLSPVHENGQTRQIRLDWRTTITTRRAPRLA